MSPVGRHSAKPVEMFDRVELLLRGPYLELFARTARPGWTALGNELGQEAAAPVDGGADEDLTARPAFLEQAG